MIRIPDHTRVGEIVESPTRIGLGIRCLRKHSLADTLSYLPAGDDEAVSLVFGERMHHAGALRWLEDDPAIGMEYLRSESWPLNDKHTLGLAMLMYGAYSVQALMMPYAKPGEDWQLEAVEKRVILEIEPGVKLSFQLDRLIREKNSGALALFDIKTAARCDAKWSQQWNRDLQMKLYSEAVFRLYGQELSWLIIEGLAKDKPALNLVIVKDFSEEMRAEAWRAFRWVAQHDLQLLESCMVNGIVDGEKLAIRILTQTPFSPAECFAYNHPCDYLPLCDAEPSERIGLLKEGYEYHEPDYV